MNSGSSGFDDRTEEDELTLPRASINKLIKEIVPHIRVANEVRELILNCCTEFIHLVSSEANDICNQQQKKTINAEHILAGKILTTFHTINDDLSKRCPLHISESNLDATFFISAL